jgi:5'(3')-deoxyribonucleotidase
MKIAIDIDGVLADQVGAVLNVIEREYGLRYSKSDVNRAHWNFDGKDIWSEIGRLLDDNEYVLSVLPIDGSKDAIEQLAGQDMHDVFVVTARRPNAEIATREWLKAHFPSLTKYYYARTGTKHTIPSDVLVDDFDLNIVEFVKSDPNRRGILFVHPWSLNDVDIEGYSDQVYFCPEWQSVIRAIEEIQEAN